ncbi:MAG TPA: hypothetical protein P5040_05440 [Smithella sp.]|nr:hypothetical protein [Smithella sp.]HRS97608.1 hypothetical protein [Smithella sp.]
MKKTAILIVLLALVMMPTALWAKSLISDSEMDLLTGEAGVSIAFTNVTMTGTQISSLSLGDSDGFTGYTTAGYLGISNVSITGTTANINGTANIDIGTSGTSTRLNMLLPNITLGTANVTAYMKLDSNSNLTTTTRLLDLSLQGFTTTLNGTVTVFAH